MNHSHPRTFALLTRLAKQNKVDLHALNADKSLEDLCVRIRLKVASVDRVRKIEIDIPKDLNDNTPNVKRIFNCFSFWIPFCLQILDRKGHSFSLCLNASDWGHADFLSMTSNDPNNIIPDEYAMFESQNLKKLHSWNSFDEFSKTWLTRKNIVFWRGSTTGPPITSIQSLTKMKRIKVSLLYKNQVGFDIRISNIVENKIPKQIIRQWLQKQAIQGRKVSEDQFRRYKYYPDIPGNNEMCGSWGTIRKYLRGNLVFKPNHESKMYYDKLMEPWYNYIPVDSDFLELDQLYSWVEFNQNEAVRIAWRGYCIANKYLRNLENHFINSAIRKLEILK